MSDSDSIATSEKKIEKLVDQGFTYHEAFSFLGVQPEDAVKDDEPPRSLERKKHMKVVIANNLGERAIHLLAAADKYRDSNDSGKLVHELYVKGDETASDATLAEQVVFKGEGDQEFNRSWYAGGLMKRKLDSITDRQAAKEGQTDFFDLSTNPNRAEELATLTESWTDQKNRAQTKKKSA